MVYYAVYSKVILLSHFAFHEIPKKMSFGNYRKTYMRKQKCYNEFKKKERKRKKSHKKYKDSNPERLRNLGKTQMQQKNNQIVKK